MGNINWLTPWNGSGFSQENIYNAFCSAIQSLHHITKGTAGTPDEEWYEDKNGNRIPNDKVYWHDGKPGHYVGPADGKKWGEDSGDTDWGDVPDHQAFDGFEFDHWEDDDTYTLDANFTIDECKWASVVVPSESKDPFWFVFDKEKTPVIYNREEQRAVIPTESIIDDYNFNSTRDSILQDPEHLADGSKAIMWRTKNGTDYQVENLYDEVMESVQEHELWNLPTNPYRLTISTAEGYKLFLVSGVWIEDTYKVADEDNPIDLVDSVQERNYLGSVNVYAKLNRMETDEFGDDVYFVRATDALWVSGYTDGIIFDGTRYVSTKLNAYNHPKEILVNKLSVTDTTLGSFYNSFMWNRKNSSVQYKEDPNNARKVNHVIDLLEIDSDIELTGHTKLFAPGDWELFPAPLAEDIVAENNRWYSSPILNYRFNLEDPDAKTQLYEIMPDADPDSTYPHIVIVHVYYARNVNVGDENTPTGTAYIAAFGHSNIATTSSPFMWNPLKPGANFWDEDNPKTIDSMIWFYASPMRKDVEYYDEIPNGAMESLYGMVNGRYKKNNPTGRFDLRVDTPKFNIPNTVKPETIRIYISVREYYPKESLVQYKWDNPWIESDSITLINGDYVTFSSDSVTIKDVLYKDLLGTINFDTIELSEQGNYEHIFPIEKPITTRDNYTNYLLNVRTDNSDVIAMRYPLEIIFDDGGYAEVGVTFKGVVNATTKWAPRIHNGYYYINEQEYHAYSEFNVEANFEELEEKNFRNISGYLEIDVELLHKAGDPEFYTIRKNSRSELIQNEEEFMWYPGQGLGLKPYIDGVYYKEYLTYTYYSPVLYFPNVLSSPGPIEVEYDYTDSSSYVPMFVRSYLLEEGKWSDWEIWNNNTAPTQVPNSCAYQVKFDMQASTQNEDLELEDYMCCYLDWKDDQDEQFCTNIVTVTDSLRPGIDPGNGIYTSKIIDFGCETEINLDIYGTDGCILYGAADNDAAKLQMSNITFEELPGFGHTLKGRYLRYRIVVPHGAKCFWLHKKFLTKKTTVIMPILSEIKMTGTYVPTDIKESVMNIESFNIPTDNQEHQIFDSVYDIIAEDVHNKGFVDSEIKKVTLKCNSSNINIIYDSAIENEYPVLPGLNKLDRPVKAKGPLEMDSIIKYTPFIFAEKNPASDFDEIIIKGTPQQYCPITVEDINEMPFTRVYDVDPSDMIYKENHYFIDRKERPDASIPEDDIDHDLHYIKLHRNDFDPKTLEIFLNDNECDEEDYHIVNNLVIWDTLPKYGDHVLIQYKIKNSFYAEVVYEDKDNPAKENTTTITIYTDYDSEIARHDAGKWTYREDKKDWVNFEMRYKVFFETNDRNNKFIAEKLSLNPIYRTDYKGFIYLTDEHNEPYKINIYCNPLCLKAGGYDKVDISFEVLDIDNNPVIEKQIDIDCSHGILRFDDEPSVIHRTDMNGVVHIVYESSPTPCTDTIRARVLSKLLNPEKGIYEDTEISNSIEIVNEA